MTDCLVQKKMAFTNKQEMIHPFLQEVAEFIERYQPRYTDRLGFKAKVIITELLTNSIKHAGDVPTQVELLMNYDSLTITKTDSGKPFDLKHESLSWPLPPTTANPLTIYADALNGLFARIASPYSLSFYAEEYPENGEFFATISEHYGLMIICRASDSFVYEFDNAAKKNTFIVNIKFG